MGSIAKVEPGPPRPREPAAASSRGLSAARAKSNGREVKKSEIAVIRAIHEKGDIKGDVSFLLMEKSEIFPSLSNETSPKRGLAPFLNIPVLYLSPFLSPVILVIFCCLLQIQSHYV